MKIVYKGKSERTERNRLLADPVPHFWRCLGCGSIVLAEYSEMIDHGTRPREDGKPNLPRDLFRIKNDEAFTYCPFCGEENMFLRSFGDRAERFFKFISRTKE